MKVLENVFYVLAMIGVICVSFATLGSIGYGLYLWGSVGIAFSTSVWTAFVLWLKLVFSGLLLAVIGFIGADYFENKDLK